MLAIFFLFGCMLHAQDDPYKDSLLTRLKSAKLADTLRATLYIDLAEHIQEEQEWTYYNQLAYRLADSLLKAEAPNSRFFKTIKANALTNKGFYYDYKGDKDQALTYYFQALKLHDEVGNRAEKASVYGNLGVLFTNQGDYREALDYLNKALYLKKKYAPDDLAVNYLNLGVVYEGMGDLEKGFRYNQLALKTAEEVGDPLNIANACNNIGTYYYKKRRYREAIPYLSRAIILCDEIEDFPGKAWDMANLGNCYLELEKADSALILFHEARIIARDYNYPELSLNLAEKFYAYHLKQGNWQSAHNELLNVRAYEDTLSNIQDQKEGIRRKLAYDHQLEKTKIQVKQNEERRRSAQTRYFILSILFLVLLAAFLIYRRYLITRKQKHLIEEQKVIVDKQNKEMLASIKYAKLLQDAILPDTEGLTSFWKDTFLFYLPKDVVAGDFYWFTQKNERNYVAVADCTGHGVPGAMVSVVCANALNLASEGEREPGKILDLTRQHVVEQFSGSQNMQDGMDIALCAVDRNTDKLFFAGANNPCWVLRDGEFIILTGSKQPVGRYDHYNQFETKELQLKPGDWVYLFTDGFPDQFGGRDGKKLKSSGLKELILSLNGIEGKGQKERIDLFFQQWKGEEEQTDDLCMIGFSV